MFKYLRFILTLALLSVVAHLAVAFDAIAGNSALISGNSNERFEFTVVLDLNRKFDGRAGAIPAADCGLRFFFEVFKAEDPSVSVFVEEVVLSTGGHQVIDFGFGDFDGNGVLGRRHLVVRVDEVRRVGICQILLSAVVVGPAGETSHGVLPLGFLANVDEGPGGSG